MPDNAQVPTKPGAWWRRNKNGGRRVGIAFVFSYDSGGDLHWRHSRGGRDFPVADDGLWAGAVMTPDQVRAIESEARRDAFMEAADMIEISAGVNSLEFARILREKADE